FVVPGIVYGYAAGSVKTHRDVIGGMSKAMSGMGYYIVMAFFAAQFIYAFGQSNLGALLASKGANTLQALGMRTGATLVGFVLLSGVVKLLVGSASAKWALIGAVMVPMLMQLGISPDLTQAAYRVGDSSTNIITPLLPYFPLIVVFCQKYVKGSGIGTLLALMLPFSATLLVVWTAFLVGCWVLEMPLGGGASYVYPAGGGPPWPGRERPARRAAGSQGRVLRLTLRPQRPSSMRPWCRRCPEPGRVAVRSSHFPGGVPPNEFQPRRTRRSGHGTARQRRRHPRVRPGHGPPASAVDAVHDRVLGALRVLRHALGAGAVHRGAVLRRRRHRRGAGKRALRRLPGIGVRGCDLRRLRRRQGDRLPALDPARRGVHGGRPVPDHRAQRRLAQ